MKVTVCQFDEQLGVLLPDELISSLGWSSGDVLEVEVENDGFKIVRVETAIEHGMRIAKQAMEKYRGALEKLAKE